VPEGDKDVKVSWSHKGEPVAVTGRYVEPAFNELAVLDAVLADAGQYSCTAVMKGHDRVTASLEVTVQGKYGTIKVYL